jgi:hypothetical protein
MEAAIMKRLWKGCLGLALSLGACRAGADEIVWRPVPAPATTNRPIVTLHAPVPLQTHDIQPVTYSQPPKENPPYQVRAQSPDPFLGGSPSQPPPPPPYLGTVPGLPSSNAERLFCGVSTSNSGSGGGFFEQSKEAIGNIPETLGINGNGNRCLFQSDHAFDVFCSPVTNPFFMQDPRSLTEVKPLLIYEHVPGSTPVFQGGDAWFFGLQGRLAITEMFSLVVNKLGFVSLRPHNSGNGIGSSTGFAETMFGPQFTFIRSDTTKTLLAAGLTFDVAWGSHKVFQDTGSLSLIPYLSFGQNFLESGWGSFNFINTTGYSFATDDHRNDFFYSSFHLDYDVANLHKIYPLLELNWTHYTTNGHPPNFFGFNGGDLVNFGNGDVAGHNNLSLAAGARYKFAEWFQIGAAVEFPLVNRSNSLMDYRLQLDLIFRY